MLSLWHVVYVCLDFLALSRHAVLVACGLVAVLLLSRDVVLVACGLCGGLVAVHILV